jgi:transcriptional regulator with XRE-family HTH domain
METLTAADVLNMLRSHISDERSQKDLAREIGVSETYVSLVLAGKRQPGPKVLTFLGLRRVVTRTITYKRAAQRR